MIGIINYRCGNLQNLQNALSKIGADSILLDKPEDMERADKFILPGVGAFGHAAKNLHEFGFWEPLILRFAEETPILGICVGMQLLFSKSFEDGEHKGLNLIPGEVRRFTCDFKIPQMGWNQPELMSLDDPLLYGIDQGAWFYFVHSYACHPEDSAHILGRANYGEDFCAITRSGHLWGTQFHPEKSQDAGMRLLKNFVELC